MPDSADPIPSQVPPDPSARPDPDMPPRKAPAGGKLRKPLTDKQRAAASQRLERLRARLLLRPLDAPSSRALPPPHEDALRALGLLDFAHLDLAADAPRPDLVAPLVAYYDAACKRSFVRGVRVAVSRSDLARALSLPSKAASAASAAPPDVDAAVVVSAVLQLLRDYVFLPFQGDDMCILPQEVATAEQAVREGSAHRVDWAGLIWGLVEKELLELPNRDDCICYYGPHLQRLIQAQKPNLFELAEEGDRGELAPEASVDVEMEEEDGDADVKSKSLLELEPGNDDVGADARSQDLEESELGNADARNNGLVEMELGNDDSRNKILEESESGNVDLRSMDMEKLEGVNEESRIADMGESEAVDEDAQRNSLDESVAGEEYTKVHTLDELDNDDTRNKILEESESGNVDLRSMDMEKLEGVNEESRIADMGESEAVDEDAQRNSLDESVAGEEYTKVHTLDELDNDDTRNKILEESESGNVDLRSMDMEKLEGVNEESRIADMGESEAVDEDAQRNILDESVAGEEYTKAHTLDELDNEDHVKGGNLDELSLGFVAAQVMTDMHDMVPADNKDAAEVAPERGDDVAVPGEEEGEGSLVLMDTVVRTHMEMVAAPKEVVDEEAEGEEDNDATGLSLGISSTNGYDSVDLEEEENAENLDEGDSGNEEAEESEDDDAFEECKDGREMNWRVGDGKDNGGMTRCLQRSNSSAFGGMQFENLNKGDIEMRDELSFDDFPGRGSLERMTSSNLLQAMNSIPASYDVADNVHDLSSGEFLAIGVDAHKNGMDLGPGSSYLFGNNGKRHIGDIDGYNSNMQVEEQFPQCSQQKRMRHSNSGSISPGSSDFNSNFMVPMQNLMVEASKFYKQKDQEIQNLQMEKRYFADMLQEKDALIQSLNSARFEQQNRWQAQLRRFEHDLNVMAQLVTGYKKALKQTRASFDEYRKKFPCNKPRYDDVPDGGGLVLPVRELERRRLEVERQKLVEANDMIGKFEQEWFSKLNDSMSSLHSLSTRMEELSKGIHLIKETRKARFQAPASEE